MKISYNWLKEYVDVKNSAAMVAHWLTMAGLEVNSVEEKGKDSILEIEITSNRPDWLSLVGVAREVSAITGKHLKSPKAPSVLPVLTREKDIKVEVEDKLLCPRYIVRVLDAVNVGPSPKWLKDHLESIGLRPINNVVDVTNFCLFELGQPLHAFDYDKLAGKKIVVRKARKGERITTIDRVTRELDSEMLVIADEQKAVAIAGIMGGLDTEVSVSTKTVLLESAYFDPISIRRTQRRLGLSTDSSYRFERGVDPDGVLFASNRAARLIVETASAKTGVIKDAGVKVCKVNSVRLSVDRVNRLLNIELATVAAKRILESLGFSVAGAQQQMKVDVPSFRRDIKREEDLVEEIARIYGYDKVAVTIPRMVGHSNRVGSARRVEGAAKQILVGEGLDEVINYSLVPGDDLKKVSSGDDGLIVIKNPLSNQQEAMRRTLIPGMLNAARFNINRKVDDLGIFELSKIYYRTRDREFREEASLCILMSGKAGKDWRRSADVDFFEIKGVVDTLLGKLGISAEYQDMPTENSGVFQAQRSAAISANKNIVGCIGEVKRDILGHFDIKKKVFLCEIQFEKLIKFACEEKRFTPLAKFLPIRRDISLIIGDSVYFRDMAQLMKESGGKLLKEVELADEYFGEQIPSGKKGLTFSLEYLDETRQLTDEEIEKAHSAIKESLINKFGAAFR